MASPAENVQAFRNKIDEVIEFNNRGRGDTWPANSLCTTLGSMTLLSVAKRNGRSSFVGGFGSEHTWAAVFNELPINRYTGAVALVSYEESSENLWCNWAVSSPVTEKPVIVSHELDSPQTIEQALKVITNPQWNGDTLAALDTVSATEMQEIEETFYNAAHRDTEIPLVILRQGVPLRAPDPTVSQNIQGTIG